jgi:polar amino acid transport system ATP-binding protein
MSVAIGVQDLCQAYEPSKPVLKGVTFALQTGETLCVLGENGAGKTTLLKCIAGLLDVSSGSIKLRLPDPRRSRPHLPCMDEAEDKAEIVEVIRSGQRTLRRTSRRRIGYVSQHSDLWPHLTVLKNVVAPLVDVHGDDVVTASEKARRALNDLKVAEKDFHTYPSGLSGGMARRVAIARALVIEPDMLLLDEVTSHLDPGMAEAVLGLLEKRFLQDPDRTVISVTHRVDLLSRWVPKVLILQNGEVVEFTKASEMLENPSSDVAKILPAIGSSNVEWVFANHCLKIARGILQRIIEHRTENTNIFQSIATEVSELLAQLEPRKDHLVLLVTVKSSAGGPQLRIMGACQSRSFRVDGRHSDKLPREIRLDSLGYTIVDGSRIPSDGLPFDSGHQFQGSLIAGVWQRDLVLDYRYAPHDDPIYGVHNTFVPSMVDPVARARYYEFSKNTNNVWLFSMELNSKPVGVLSIDTTSEERWLPFVVKELALISELGAIAIRIAGAAG